MDGHTCTLPLKAPRIARKCCVQQSCALRSLPWRHERCTEGRGLCEGPSGPHLYSGLSMAEICSRRIRWWSFGAQNFLQFGLGGELR